MGDAGRASTASASTAYAPTDVEASFRRLLSSSRAFARLEWGRHSGETAVQVFHTDIGYARWMVRELYKNPCANTPFTSVAFFFKEVLEQFDKIGLNRGTALMQAVHARQTAVRDELERVKRLRRSTASGQLETVLSADLLMHICLLTGNPTSLTRLPRVSRGLRVLMGNRMHRLPVIAKLVFESPPLVPARTDVGSLHGPRPLVRTTPHPRSLLPRLLHTFLIQPLVDPKAVETEGLAAFLERASRVAAHRSEFRALRHKARLTHDDSVRAYGEAKALMYNAFLKGARNKLDGRDGRAKDKGGARGSCHALVNATNTAFEKRVQLNVLMKDLAEFSIECKLGVSVPPGLYTSRKAEDRLVAFLGTPERVVR